MNITEANQANVVLKALLQLPFAPGDTPEAQAARLTIAAVSLAERAHQALHAGLTGEDVARTLAAPEPLPILDALIEEDGSPLFQIGPNVKGAFLCLEDGRVAFLTRGEPTADTMRVVMEMLSDAAVGVVRAVGLDPTDAEGGQ